MPSSSVSQREREFQGYLQSWQIAQGSSLKVAYDVDSIEAPLDLRESGYTPQPSSDKVLTAFAQLAVLRLNVKRAMVSLIDDDNQIILAEATRNLPIGDLTVGPQSSTATGGRNPNAPIDPNQSRRTVETDLWLGSAILSRPDAICGHSLTDTCTAIDPDGQSYSAPGLIIPDCRLEPRFNTRPYVISEPGVRFYAGVPIISPKGHKIGSYAVSDEKPRDGLAIEELHFMQSIAQAVMEHLEWARDRVDRFKGERIVRGLASFIEGSTTLIEDNGLEIPRSYSTVRPPEMKLSATRPSATRSLSLGLTPELERPQNVLPTRPRLDSPSGHRPTSSEPPSMNPSQSGSSSSSSLSRMFQRAADILRFSTLADGVLLYGATAADSKPAIWASKTSSRHSSDEDEGSQSPRTGSRNPNMSNSDSDTSSYQPFCKILASSLNDDRVLDQGSALSVNMLEKYFSTFPKGKTFSFTKEGHGISSEEDSSSEREHPHSAETKSTQRSRLRRVFADHKELLKQMPGAKAVVFVPLYDYVEDKLAGGCFLWTSVTGRMMNLDEDLSYLRAFGNSIMSEVARINTQKNESAKTTFIASMSHELRSPLHGILGAVEFLKDTTMDTYQSGLTTSIATCGKTLLDTLNHVLDYSKINKFGRVQVRRASKQNKIHKLSPDSLESMNLTAVVDVGVLVEEVVDSIVTGHGFKKLPGAGHSEAFKLLQGESIESSQDPGAEGPVSVLLDICPRTSWMAETQPGALRRIIMNLFGNALKYTPKGYILVSLSNHGNVDGSHVDAVIRVVDTGKGMSKEYQQNHLFVPFRQEDSFQPGTGLGLSIVKQIVNSLGGTLEVKSQQHKGTEITVRLRLKSVPDNTTQQSEDTMRSILEKTRGQRLVLLENNMTPEPPGASQAARALNETLADTCTDWFGMEVSQEEVSTRKDADIYLYCEPPSLDVLKRRFKNNKEKALRNKKIPIVIVCLNAEEAVQTVRNQSEELSKLAEIVEVIAQPCGPRKMAKVFSHCLKRIEEEAAKTTADTSSNTEPPQVELLQIAGVGDDLKQIECEGEQEGLDEGTYPLMTATRPAAILSLASPEPLDPATPLLAASTVPEKQASDARSDGATHVLLVDDNVINLQLLVMFMKKCSFTYQEAENGQIALDKYKLAHLPNSPSKRFHFILMDISMPVMNGIEATRRIREFEREEKLQPANIIALTGLASDDARREAMSAGVDVFLPKPVRFAELKKLLMPE